MSTRPVAHDRDAGSDLDRPEYPPQQIAVVLNPAGPVGKHEIEFARRGREPPRLQGIEEERA